MKPTELKALVKETMAQWSDGIGESQFWEKVQPGVIFDLAPPRQRESLHTEQVDDGYSPPRKKISPLLKAAEAGDLDKIEKLLAKGENIESRDKRGRTVLRAALWSSQVDAALLLIEKGADPNARDMGKDELTRQTPLHVTCRLGQPSVAKALLAKGAELDARDSYGYTPLMWAGSYG